MESKSNRRPGMAGSRAGSLNRPAAKQRKPRWTKAELEIVEQVARRVVSGEIKFARRAVIPCMALLERRALLSPKETRPQPRTWHGVYESLRNRLPAGAMRPRPPAWSTAEKRIIARHARGVVAGRYVNAAAAARACFLALKTIHRPRDESNALGRAERSKRAVYGRVRLQCRALGVRSGQHRLHPGEKKIVLSWVERYWWTRGAEPPWCIVDLADLMCGELRRKGFRRSPSSCETVLSVYIVHSRRAHPEWTTVPVATRKPNPPAAGIPKH